MKAKISNHHYRINALKRPIKLSLYVSHRERPDGIQYWLSAMLEVAFSCPQWQRCWNYQPILAKSSLSIFSVVCLFSLFTLSHRQWSRFSVEKERETNIWFSWQDLPISIDNFGESAFSASMCWTWRGYHMWWNGLGDQSAASKHFRMGIA